MADMALLANLLRRSAALRYRRDLGLPPVEWGLVKILGRYKTMSLGQLSQRASFDKAQVSRAITSLTAQRMVSRAAGRDPREVHLTLTNRGLQAYRLLTTVSQERSVQLFASLTQRERAVIMAVLPRMTEAARAILAQEHELGKVDQNPG